METKLKKINGIDVSKLTIDVYNGAKHYCFENNKKGFKALLKATDGHFVMEATGSYHMHLASYLHAHDQEVSVVNPLSVKRFSQMRFIRAKTDKQDASTIFEYAQVNELKLWAPAKDYSVKIKGIYAAIDLMQKHRTGYTNQLEAFHHMSVTEGEVIKEIKKQIRSIEKSIEKLGNKAEELVKEHAPAIYSKLLTIPSIGKKTATMLIAVTNEFADFSNSKQLSSYIGICPRVYQSGTSVKGKGKICKMGMSRMRSTLFMCSLTAIKSNKACLEMYKRLVDNGKPKKVALVAVMNKLVKQAYAVGTKLEDYSEIRLN